MPGSSSRRSRASSANGSACRTGCRRRPPKRYNRAGLHIDDLATHAKILQHAFKHAGVLLKHLIGKIDGLLGAALGFGQQSKRRKFKFAGLGKAQVELGILLDFFAQLDFLGFARDPTGRGFGNSLLSVPVVIGGFIPPQFPLPTAVTPGQHGGLR